MKRKIIIKDIFLDSGGGGWKSWLSRAKEAVEIKCKIGYMSMFGNLKNSPII